MGHIDRWTEFKNGLAYDVYVIPDREYTPDEYTTRNENPELFEAFENGSMRYVGIEVHLSADAEFCLSLWGIEYGSCPNWPADVGRSALQEHYVPDLITKILADVRERADMLRELLAVADENA